MLRDAVQTPYRRVSHGRYQTASRRDRANSQETVGFPRFSPIRVKPKIGLRNRRCSPRLHQFRLSVQPALKDEASAPPARAILVPYHMAGIELPRDLIGQIAKKLLGFHIFHPYVSSPESFYGTDAARRDRISSGSWSNQRLTTKRALRPRAPFLSCISWQAYSRAGVRLQVACSAASVTSCSK